MNKSLKLIPIEQVLLSYNPISSEINRIIGLYNSRNFDNEINIQSIDGSIFITEGEKEMLEKFDDCYAELTELNERELFTYAFRLGARMMLEVLLPQSEEGQ